MTSCSEEESAEFKPNFVILGIIIVSNLIVFIIYAFLGYLSAGYHFYEQAIHDAVDEEERKVREARLRRYMEEQELEKQMKKAKEERQMKEAMKMPKLITVEEHEKVIRERRLSEQRLHQRVKESEKQVLALEEKLKILQAKEKKRIQKIQVSKPEMHLKEGEKLLTGARKPIIPKKNPPEPKAAVATNKGIREVAEVNQNPRGQGLLQPWLKLNQQKCELTPKMCSTENNPSEVPKSKKSAKSKKSTKDKPKDEPKDESKKNNPGSVSTKDSDNSDADEKK